MAQQLRGLLVLLEDWSLVPSAHVRQLTVTCNSSSRRSSILPQPLACLWDRPTQTYSSIKPLKERCGRGAQGPSGVRKEDAGALPRPRGLPLRNPRGAWGQERNKPQAPKEEPRVLHDPSCHLYLFSAKTILIKKIIIGFKSLPNLQKSQFCLSARVAYLRETQRNKIVKKSKKVT